jgi:hypothetical protein
LLTLAKDQVVFSEGCPVDDNVHLRKKRKEIDTKIYLIARGTLRMVKRMQINQVPNLGNIREQPATRIAKPPEAAIG